MKNYLKLLFTTKTGRVAIGGVVAAWGAYLSGAMGLNEAIIATVAAVQSVNIRHAVEKSGPQK